MSFELVGFIIYVLVTSRFLWIDGFKISYYEKKLENRDVDISHIKNIGLIGIFKL